MLVPFHWETSPIENHDGLDPVVQQEVHTLNAESYVPERIRKRGERVEKGSTKQCGEIVTIIHPQIQQPLRLTCDVFTFKILRKTNKSPQRLVVLPPAKARRAAHSVKLVHPLSLYPLTSPSVLQSGVLLRTRIAVLLGGREGAAKKTCPQALTCLWPHRCIALSHS